MRNGRDRVTGMAPGGCLVVGQATLEQYRALLQAQNEREALRKYIVHLLEAGATVEFGPLTARLRRAQRRFSAEQLERLLGVSQVESLRSQLQPIVSIQLVVEPSSPPAR